MKAEITVPGESHRGKVLLDGTDVSGGVRGLVLRAGVSQVTKLVLDLAIVEDVRIGGEVQVIIPSGTRDALIALGWTPPPES